MRGRRQLAEINASRRVQSADRQLVVTSSNKVSNKLETKTTGKTSASSSSSSSSSGNVDGVACVIEFVAAYRQANLATPDKLGPKRCVCVPVCVSHLRSMERDLALCSDSIIVQFSTQCIFFTFVLISFTTSFAQLRCILRPHSMDHPGQQRWAISLPPIFGTVLSLREVN